MTKIKKKIRREELLESIGQMIDEEGDRTPVLMVSAAPRRMPRRASAQPTTCKNVLLRPSVNTPS